MRHFLLTLATMLFACCSSDHETQAETLQTTSGMTISITIGGQVILNEQQTFSKWW
jgi:hypothetical protein